MHRRSMVALTLGTAAVLTLSACGGSSSDDPSTDGGSDAKVGKVGVILPDTASSTRWEQQDRPELTAAFQAAGVESDIQNAQGDKNKFQSIADGMINEGVSVLLITDLDAGSGTAVIKKATAAGIPVIDYDRLTLGGGAKYYVSFDNVAVGTAIGEGLVKCLKDDGVTSGGVIELDGSPTDNNATLFKEGYDKAIKTPVTRSPPSRPSPTGTTPWPPPTSPSWTPRPRVSTSGSPPPTTDWAEPSSRG